MFVFDIFLRFFIFFHAFSRFLTQVYRFYRNFLVFHFLHRFSAFLFYATAFLLSFIDYFPENVISDLNWIAAYISGVCSHLFLQLSCVIIFGIEEVVYFQYFCTYLLFYIYCFGFWHKSIDIFFSVNFPVFWHLFLTFSLIATSLFSFFDFVTRILIFNWNW